MEFEDKIVLITGAASGIGREAAFLFAKEGAKLVLADINEEQGLSLVKELRATKTNAEFIHTDVADIGSITQLFNKIKDQFGCLDIAINNAGITGSPGRMIDINVEDWNQVFAINSTSIFLSMQHEIKMMLAQGGGVILNTSSIAGIRGLPNSIAYTASKHAVVGMTKTAAMEYARKNIRINAICPAFTVTKMFQPEMMDQISEGLSKKLLAQIPMKRFGDPKEIAQAMLWICSDKASFITGQAIPVDGGVTA